MPQFQSDCCQTAKRTIDAYYKVKTRLTQILASVERDSRIQTRTRQLQSAFAVGCFLTPACSRGRERTLRTRFCLRSVPRTKTPRRLNPGIMLSTEHAPYRTLLVVCPPHLSSIRWKESPSAPLAPRLGSRTRGLAENTLKTHEHHQIF